MISKIISFLSSNKCLLFILLLIIPSTFSLFGQTINPKILNFDKICAGGPHPTNQGQVFNEYQAGFSISGFSANETFSVILSSPSGSFSTPIATTTLPPLAGTPVDTPTEKTITFAIPTNLVGSNTYQLRVKSSTGITSPSFIIHGTTNVRSFPAYFKAYNGSFYINDKKSALSFCNNNNLILTIDNPTPSIPDSSPANFPQLTYNWYKDNVLIPGQTASTLTVTLEGEYYAEINYGPCTDVNNRSQAVIITRTTGVTEFSSTISADLDKINRINEGETLTVTTTTTALNPSYQWFFNDAPLSNATQSSLTITTAGSYKVTITQNTGCTMTEELSFEVGYKDPLSTSKISNIVTPNGDGINDTWIVPDQYSNTHTQVEIISTLGKKVFQTDNYDNYIGWPQETVDFKDFNPVYYYILTPTNESAKKGSITVFK